MRKLYGVVQVLGRRHVNGYHHLMLTWGKENGYDPMKPTSWLLYIDANYLYGYAMLQPQPAG